MTAQQNSGESAPADELRDRSSGRLNFFLGTALRSDAHGAVDARVRNLSKGGMMLELPDGVGWELGSGDRVVADLRNIGSVKGEVAWVDGRRIGVRFDKPIDPERARKPVGGAGGQADGTRPR